MAYDPTNPPPSRMDQMMAQIGASGAAYYQALVAGGVPDEVAKEMLDRYSHTMFAHIAKTVAEHYAARLSGATKGGADE